MNLTIAIVILCVSSARPPAFAADEFWTLDYPWMSVPGGSRALVSHRYPQGIPLSDLAAKGLVICVLYNENTDDKTIVICATNEQHRKIVDFLVRTRPSSPLKQDNIKPNK
jgi:hypothetical protein